MADLSNDALYSQHVRDSLRQTDIQTDGHKHKWLGTAWCLWSVELHGYLNIMWSWQTYQTTHCIVNTFVIHSDTNQTDKRFGTVVWLLELHGYLKILLLLRRTLDGDACYPHEGGCRCLLFVGCLMSQQHASVSQGRICSDKFTCCHTEIEVADQTFHLTQSQYTDTRPTW